MINLSVVNSEQLSSSTTSSINQGFVTPINPEQIAAQNYTQKLLEQGFKKQALHAYQDAEGQVIYWRIRLKHPLTGEKWIRPLSRDDNSNFVLKEPSFSQLKPLYQLPRLKKDTISTVWIVEGELCVDRLIKFNQLATTSGGVDSVQTTDWSPLIKRHIIIWPDNDNPGFEYAFNITKKLQLLNCEVQWLDIKQLNLPPKGDFIDWLAQNPHVTHQDIVALPLIPPPPNLISSFTEDRSSSKKEKQDSEATNLFISNSRGVFYLGDEEPRWICSPLTIKALVRDKLSENWGRLLEFSDADGQLHQWAMPMEMLKGSGEELRGELLRQGLEIATGVKTRNLLIEYIVNSKPATRARCVKRTGWHSPVFVFPNQTIGKTSEIVIYQSEAPVHDYKQAGSLADWQHAIALPCSGNSYLIFAISCAFAAMLLHPMGAESGGINLVGESSTGKTTALRVAASVFGAPDYLHRWRATTNGLEALAALRSDTLLVLDELAQVDAKEAGETAYMLANGSGKARAGKNGHARTCAEWRMLFLSAGEISLSQHLREVGKKIKAGQEVRLVDLPADAGAGMGIFENIHAYQSPALFSKALTEATTQYHGVAAKAFLEAITSDYDQLPMIIKPFYQQFISDNLLINSSGQVYRVCERFALIAAAGEMAAQYQITQWPQDEAYRAVSRCFSFWLRDRGSAENQERSVILSQVRHFFEAHGESRFTDWTAQNSKTINRAGFKKMNPQNTSTIYYVMPEIFREEICAGLNYRSVTNTLIASGWLQPDANNIPYRREHLPGIGRARCYVFTERLWES